MIVTITYKQNIKKIGLDEACLRSVHALWASVARRLFLFAVMLMVVMGSIAGNRLYGADVIAENLSCAGITAPNNLDMKTPELSWQITVGAGIKNVLQTAYQIQVASDSAMLVTGTADLWDSKKMISDQQLNVVYGGSLLQSFQKVYWRVRVWTNKGASPWSKISNWRMGMLHISDRKAEWIGYDHPFEGDTIMKFPRLCSRYLRRGFTTDKKVKSAIAYISGLGLYELHINGRKAGGGVLAPAPTDYTKTVLYNAIDVTDLLRAGENVVGVILGNGRFFAMRQNYKIWKWRTFGFPKLYFQLRIEYEDGSIKNVVSDRHWDISGKGPIRNNNEYDGEVYDARMELAGWDSPGYTCPHNLWQPVEWVDAPSGVWKAQLNPPMKIMQRLKPQRVLPAADGGFILDMGQNFAGWLEMALNGNGHRGDTVQMTFAESLVKSGDSYQLYRANLRDAKSTDYYVIKGEEKETWHPVFTYHGFRYVKINGYPANPSLRPTLKEVTDVFTGDVIYDDLLQNGQFTCSDSTINQIYQNAVWGIQSNYKGMPVDCPQRNERQPWLGDRTTGAYGESFAFNNQLLYDKWLGDIKDAQLVTGSIPDVAPNFWMYYKDDVAWPSTFLTVGEMLFHQYGDSAIIQKCYASMKLWIEYMRKKYLKDDLIDKDSYGDWCVPPDSLKVIHSTNPSKITDGALIATATFYHDLQLMTRFAVIARQPGDTSDYQKAARQIKSAFQKKYFNHSAGYYGNNTVTANLLPLAFGLADSLDELKIFNHIIQKTKEDYNNHISSGVIGIQWFLRMLSRYGRNDLAVRIAADRTYPGWGYMVANGATTIWELWNGNTANPAMNSQNHVMLLGDLLIWLYQDQAGIKSDNHWVGFKKIQFEPFFTGRLDSVSATFHSGYGWVKSHWVKKEGSLNWTIRIPPGTTATVHIPSGLNSVCLDGKSVKNLLSQEGKRQIELGSGSYIISGKFLVDK